VANLQIRTDARQEGRLQSDRKPTGNIGFRPRTRLFRSVPPPTVTAQVDETKAAANEDKRIEEQSAKSMFDMRVGVTAIVLPLCPFIILAKARYDGKDKNFAYATVGAVITFWPYT
jgi:hypothetical protein